SGNMGSYRKVTTRRIPQYSRCEDKLILGIRHKGKEIAKPITPPSETASEEDNDPKQAQRDKDMQKNLVLIAKYFKKIYNPTNNNLRTSSNSRNKNVDTTPWYKNDNRSGQFGNQRTVNVAGARKNVGSPDFVYHKEKMLLCKQAEQGVSLQAEQFGHSIQKQLKKENTTHAQELKEFKAILAETSKSLGESISVRDSCLVALQNKQTEFENYKAFNDHIIDYDKLEPGSRDRPPMLATGRYPQWRSRFLRYIDTRPNGDALRKCILSGPYKPTTILVQAVAATDDSLAIPKHTTVETLMNISLENKAHFQAEKEAIHLILTGIGDEIYSTVDACQTAQEMWEAIKRLQQALVATAQANQDPYYQTSKSHKSHAPSSKPLIPTRTHTTTRYKGKEIAKPITPLSETASEKESDLEEAQRDKDMQKNLAFIAKYFKKIYKPTNNNLKTSSNLRNKNVDTTLRPVVQQFRIQCFNCKEFGHFAKECRKPKRIKDSAYHKKKMLLCKQAEQGVPLQAEKYDWLAVMDEESDEQELEAHYSYMAKIQEVLTADTCTDSEPLEQAQNDAGYNVFANDLQHSKQSESISNTCLVETDDSKIISDSPDMCNDDIQNNQNDVESDDKRVALANLIANLKLDVDENKKIQKQLKKANTTLAQELNEYKTILVETSKTPGESNSVGDSCLVALQNKQTEFEKYKAFNDRTVDNDKLERKGISVETKFDKPSVVRQPNAQRILKPSVLGKPAPFSNSLERRYFPKTKSVPKTNVSEGLSKPVTAQTLPQIARQAVSNTNMLRLGMYRIDNKTTQTRALQSPQTVRNTNPRVSTSTRVNHKTNVSRPQHMSNQLKDKVLSNNSQVKPKKTHVEEHPRISGISNKTKSVTACNDSLNSRTSNVNVVCATCGKCLVDSNHFACVTKMLNDMNARTKKPNHMTANLKLLCNFIEKFLGTVHFGNDQFAPILGYGDLVQGNVTINRVYYVKGLNHNLFSVGQFCDADLEVAFRKSTCFVRDLQGNNLLTGNRGSDLYIISLQESTSSTLLCLMAKASPTQAWLWHRRLSYLNFDYINLLFMKNIVIGLRKLKFVKDQLYSTYELSKAKRSSFKLKAVTPPNWVASEEGFGACYLSDQQYKMI
nr:retrovirus-related Pol polyprotein from transposon TNT 1-94 [Tanacetum cinerariifolium]